MPNPVQGSEFTVGDITPLSFVTNIDLTDLPTLQIILTNLTTGNAFTYNNANITVSDNNTGVVLITANLSEAGEYTAQLHANNNTALVSHSGIFDFIVQSPSANFS